MLTKEEKLGIDTNVLRKYETNLSVMNRGFKEFRLELREVTPTIKKRLQPTRANMMKYFDVSDYYFRTCTTAKDRTKHRKDFIAGMKSETLRNEYLDKFKD